jgi:hypothetical protein
MTISNTLIIYFFKQIVTLVLHQELYMYCRSWQGVAEHKATPLQSSRSHLNRHHQRVSVTRLFAISSDMRSYMLLHDEYLATDRSDWWLMQLIGSCIDTSHVAFSMVLLLRHTMRTNFAKILSQKFVPVTLFVTISAHHTSWIFIFSYFKPSNFDCNSQGGRRWQAEKLPVKGAEIL